MVRNVCIYLGCGSCFYELNYVASVSGWDECVGVRMNVYGGNAFQANEACASLFFYLCACFKYHTPISFLYFNVNFVFRCFASSSLCFKFNFSILWTSFSWKCEIYTFVSTACSLSKLSSLLPTTNNIPSFLLSLFFFRFACSIRFQRHIKASINIPNKITNFHEIRMCCERIVILFCICLFANSEWFCQMLTNVNIHQHTRLLQTPNNTYWAILSTSST